MARALLLALLTLFAATASAQFDPSCGTTAATMCPYQWVGATSIAFDGSGNGLGFVGMTTQCRADFGPGARMCTSEEILQSDTLNLNDIPSQGCWLRPVFQPVASSSSGLSLDATGTSSDEPGIGQSEEDLACQSWSTTETGREGLVLLEAGSFRIQSCEAPRPVACCKPTPIPTPTSSLGVPIGALGLVGLSMLRG